MVVVAFAALCLATLINSLGLILMKQAITKTERAGAGGKPAFLNGRYIFGFSLCIGGALILIGKLRSVRNKKETTSQF